MAFFPLAYPDSAQWIAAAASATVWGARGWKYWDWQVPQAIGGEEKLVVNEIKNFHSREPWLLVIDDSGKVSIIKQELLNLDRKLSLRAHIEPATTDNSSTCPICQPSSNGTNLQFQRCIFSGVVNIRKSDRGALSCIQDLQLLMFADLFWEIDHRAIDTQRVYLQMHLLMPADDPGLRSLVSKLLQPIEDWSSDIIGQGVFVNTIAPMNLFATSKVDFWCWGTFWLLLALGCGILWSPLDLLGSSSAQADGAWSDSDNLLRRDDFWHLSSGGASATGRFRKFGSGGRAMTVSARLPFFSSGTLVLRNHLSWRAWPRWRSSCWWSKSSSSMSDDRVDSLVSSLLWSPISWSVLSSWYIHAIGDISHPQYDARRPMIGRQTFDWEWRFTAFLNASALSRCTSWFFCE